MYYEIFLDSIKQKEHNFVPLLYLCVFPLCHSQVSNAKLTFDRILVHFPLKHFVNLGKNSFSPSYRSRDSAPWMKTEWFASIYDNSSIYRPHAQEVDGEGRDEEAGGQMEKLGALLDQACGVPDVDKS